MRKFAVLGLCLAVTFSTFAFAQEAGKKGAPAAAKKAAPAAEKKAAAPAMPQPAPELKRVAYFTGDWTSEGNIQPGPMGPGGKFSGKDHSTWMPGHFFVMTHGTMNGPMGKGEETAFMGYDTKKKVYTYHAFGNMGGDAEMYTGTVSGSDWTWNGDFDAGGKMMKGKYTAHEDSPTAYSFKFEASDDGGKTWKPMMDGKATKAAAPAK